MSVIKLTSRTTAANIGSYGSGYHLYKFLASDLNSYRIRGNFQFSRFSRMIDQQRKFSQ